MMFGQTNPKKRLLDPQKAMQVAPMVMPQGIFARGRRDTLNAARPRPSEIEAAGMPGAVGGFGGGTWNVDGSPATPDRDGSMRPLPGSTAGSEEQPDHWTVEGFDKMRSEMAPTGQQLRSALANAPLGGSMRQPFDYEAAMAKLAGEAPKKVKDWQKVLAILADGLAGANGQEGHAFDNLMGRQQDYQERRRKAEETILGWQHKDYSRQNEADLRAASPFSSGRDRVVYDPATGQSHVIYDGPEDFQTYAKELNLKPGSDEYFKAVEDYVLRSSGPSAYERDVELDDHRTGNDASLERLRYNNRRGLEAMRQDNRQGMVEYRNSHPAPSRGGSARPSIVSVKTPAEAAKLAPGTRYRGPDGVVRER